MMEEKMIRKIPKEKFQFVQRGDRIHDEKLQTKAVGYLGDAWNRFRTNKSAVVAFILILVLLLFALIVPPPFQLYHQLPRRLLQDISAQM